MSAEVRIKRLTVTDIMARKGAAPLVCLTAYTAPVARILDDHVDLLLVGDSLGMVIYGLDTTLGVTLDMMVAHGAAVVRATTKACVVVDLPFGSYQASPAAAFESAARVMSETGCAAVKLEGGAEMADTVAFLVQRGVPVVGHVGLTPQHVHRLGGFRAQGRTKSQANRLVVDAEEIANAGAFAGVVEAVPEGAARRVTEAIAVPTIGIGAGAVCDGQILVTDDMLGLFGTFTPRFVKRYAELGEAVAGAVVAYARDVQARDFPGPEHQFRAIE